MIESSYIVKISMFFSPYLHHLKCLNIKVIRGGKGFNYLSNKDFYFLR